MEIVVCLVRFPNGVNFTPFVPLSFKGEGEGFCERGEAPLKLPFIYLYLLTSNLYSFIGSSGIIPAF